MPNISGKNNEWISIYFYLDKDLEEFLINCIKPATEFLYSQELIISFFFIRYMENGLHYRLRFRVAKTKDVNATFLKIKTALLDNIHGSGLLSREKAEESLQISKYFPETKRYGGPLKINIAETQFHYSTKAVMDLIAINISNWTYEVALATALKMHLTFIESMETTSDEKYQFVEFLLKVFLPYSSKIFTSTEGSDEKNRRTLTAFSDIFEAGKVKTTHDLQQFLKNIKNDNAAVYQQWIKNNNEVFREIDVITGIEERKSPNDYSNADDIIKLKKLSWHIYVSYIHMTNNRLGVKVADEAYLMYILFRFYKSD